MSVARPMLILIGAALLGLGVLAVGLNRYPYGQRPALAALLWPTNPDAVRDEAMRQIGVAAASGETVPITARAAMRDLAGRAPLWPEPFLVEATIAATSGAPATAELLFREAEARDPRSVLAHYALADRYFRSNRLDQGLEELSILARLLPSVTDTLVASLAKAARQPDSDRPLRYFFARSPQFVSPVLSELVKDPAQADRAVRLASGLTLPPEGVAWQGVAIGSLIARRDYAHALAIWRKLARVAPFEGIFNPGFAALSAPPPFNWTPAGGTAALADPLPGGGLRLIYYGRENADLTQQLLVLPPGRYRLAMTLSGIAASPGSGDDDIQLAWQVRCADGGPSLGALPIGQRAAGAVQLSFVVPPGCPGQWLTLHGTAGTFARPVELSLSGLTLRREGRP